LYFLAANIDSFTVGEDRNGHRALGAGVLRRHDRPNELRTRRENTIDNEDAVRRVTSREETKAVRGPGNHGTGEFAADARGARDCLATVILGDCHKSIGNFDEDIRSAELGFKVPGKVGDAERPIEVIGCLDRAPVVGETPHGD
jgi:hypothetical protein